MPKNKKQAYQSTVTSKVPSIVDLEPKEQDEVTVNRVKDFVDSLTPNELSEAQELIEEKLSGNEEEEVIDNEKEIE